MPKPHAPLTIRYRHGCAPGLAHRIPSPIDSLFPGASAAGALTLQAIEDAMPLSENEAKFKFCPLLKTSEDKMKFCQGSQCMMWRWQDSTKTAGWCGLAGRPLSAAD
ncbi:MAG: hypothetical protein AB7D47_07620 [Desulfovibrio sp.]